MSNDHSHDSEHHPSEPLSEADIETETYEPKITITDSRTVIGKYHVKRIIASGGMGTIYEATQEQPRRTVAVKVMKHGITSRSALRRFEHESQVLARLKHVGIAQIYEAGTHVDSYGTMPYFAMEYIPNAKPITKFVRDNNLGIRERMKLFTQVCDAVQHGHKKGIIHRDLKPSNILVDSSGQIKIIDFGIARATDSDMAITTLQTDVGQLIGTLQYMSPEQCVADPHDIDTRSDVYALGVVYYEIMTDQLPYDLSRKAIHEATRVIREDPPTPFSSISRTLRGDVETIALKALAKDRVLRYQSASDLSEDISCYLNHRPIKARPLNPLYQLGKFVRRRRVPVALSVIIFMALSFVAYQQYQASWTDAMMRTRKNAYDVFYAAQPDGVLRNPKQIIEDCTRAISMDPTLALAYALRAKAYTLAGKNDAAWLDCQKAVELDPENALVQRTLGYLHLERNEIELSKKAYDRGFQKFILLTDIPRDLHNFARVNAILGDYEQALTFHDGAIAFRPKNFMVIISKALTLRFAGQIDEAIKELDHLIQIDKKKDWATQAKLWIWEMRMLRQSPNDQALAIQDLKMAEQFATGAFTLSVIDMIKGSKKNVEALKATNNPGLRCCAYYYLAAKALVDGRAKTAKTLLRECLNTKSQGLPEYELARWHLSPVRK